MFIEVRTNQAKLITISLMQLEVITMDDDGQTLIFIKDDNGIPYRTNEPYEALLARLGGLVPGLHEGWRAPA